MGAWTHPRQSFLPVVVLCHFTVTAALVRTPLVAMAHILHLPSATAVTLPFSLTVATLVSLL